MNLIIIATRRPIVTLAFAIATATAGCAPVSEAERPAEASEMQEVASVPAKSIEQPAPAKLTIEQKAAAFAKCIWQKTPETAAIWAKTAKSSSLLKSFSLFPIDAGYSAEQLNLARIYTACGAVIGGTHVPGYAEDRYYAAILAARPATLGRDDKSYRTALCKYYLTKADGSLFMYGTVIMAERKGKFVELSNFSVPVPEALVGAAKSKKCQYAQSDGSLSDA